MEYKLVHILTGVTGTLTSWNYDDPNYIHTNNQDYGICIRREKGYCGVTYFRADETNRLAHHICNVYNKTAVLLSFNVDKNNNNGERGDDCGSDAISIPGGSLTGYGVSYERWCGSLFGAMQTTPTAVSGTSSSSENQVTTYRTPFR